MSFRPQLKRYFRYEVVPSEGVLLFSERELFLLRGAIYPHLMPLLDGRSTVDEIVTHLKGVITPVEVFYALGILQRNGYVADANFSLSPEQAAFWKLMDVEPHDAVVRMQEVPVSIMSYGRVDPAPVRSLFSSAGVQVSDDGRFCLVLTDDYLHDELETFNREAIKQKRPWMLVNPLGAELWIGPLFLPGETGCWACLAQRLRGARKVSHYLQQKKNCSDPFLPPAAVLPSTMHTAYSMAVTEAIKWIVDGRNEGIEGQVVVLDVLSFTKSKHSFVRRPQCPCCGNPALVATKQLEPFVLQSCKKAFATDGGHRVFSPEETVAGLVHHVSPISGIVSCLQANSTGGNDSRIAPSYVAVHNFIHVAWEDSLDFDFLRASLQSASGGKGKEEKQAQASALGEAIERYSGVFQGDEARIRARLRDLGNAGVAPNSCMLFSERQFTNRLRLNAAGSWRDWVPERFDEDLEIEWSPAWSLTCGERRWLPTAYCYYGYAQKYNAWFARADSNGCAAGCTREEAILQGFLELVERDGVALWWYNRLQRPCVDLSSFQDAYFQDLETYYKTLHRDLWVLDITSDLAIPSFAAISRRHDNEVEDLILGFGAHLDPRLAVLRALTEVNQSLPKVLPNSSGEQAPIVNRDPKAFAWLKTATLQNQPYLAPGKALAAKTRADYSSYYSEDLYTDVMTCVVTVKAKDLETLVLDQTRPDTGLHVVKVIVPGLRHFWARFAPGRLYDVPVQMGWLEKSLTEDQFNPQPFCL